MANTEEDPLYPGSTSISELHNPYYDLPALTYKPQLSKKRGRTNITPKKKKRK